MPETILLVDGMYLVFSSFYAHRQMRTLKGQATGAVFGFINRVESLIRELKPDRVAVAFDSREKNFRHRLFAEYKAKRDLPPDELVAQLPLIREYLDGRGIDRFEFPGFEADDIIAHIAQKHAGRDQKVVIFSADKDLFQLINDRVTVFHPKLKRELDRDELKEFFGLFPEQVVDYLLLVGDASDNVPGIPGVGEKTALKLIGQFGSVDEMMKNPDRLDAKTRDKITGHGTLFKLTRQLVDLNRVPEIPATIEIAPFIDRVSEPLLALYRRLSFQSLLKKSGETPGGEEPLRPGGYRILAGRGELIELKEKIRDRGQVSLDIETSALEFFRAQPVGISFSFSDEGYYIPFQLPAAEKTARAVPLADFIAELGPVLADARIGKTGHNLKFDLLHLKRAGLDVDGLADDTMVISYLLFPNRRSHQLKDLTAEFLNVRQIEFNDLVGRGKSQVPLADVPLEKISRYCIDDSLLSLRLAGALGGPLKKKGLQKLYRDIEMPLVRVLTEMEYQGIKVDKLFLNKAQQVLEEKIRETEAAIFALAGYELNLNSPQQLGELLFVKMNLPMAKKTLKTRAFSTDIEVLTELKGFPVVEKIIDYRTYKKMLSTYVLGLIETADEHGRIHTSFNQTVTATGRLSSSNPNLQNIPVGELGGVNLRRAFVAETGQRLLSADYSQIELRVMAHFSRDRNLIEAFERDEDIHAHTAHEVFPGQTGPEWRRRAKIINFSIIYGSGAFSLAKELGVSFNEAKQFIERYFEKYSGVKRFMDRVVSDAEKEPEVRTISGRIRPIPEIQSANRNVKENGNRMAINTVIQGSAADIIKTAMIRIQEHLVSLRSRLLLQVHDELLFEYPPDEEKQLFALVKKEMEQALTLRVPLKVSLKTGLNWADLTGTGI